MKIKSLRNKRDFTNVFTAGKRLYDGGLILWARKGPATQKEPRVGVVAPKRYVPLAVTRNYIRRVIYAYFRKQPARFKEDVEIIVKIREKFGKMKKREIGAKITGQLEEAIKKIP